MLAVNDIKLHSGESLKCKLSEYARIRVGIHVFFALFFASSCSKICVVLPSDIFNSYNLKKKGAHFLSEISIMLRQSTIFQLSKRLVQPVAFYWQKMISMSMYLPRVNLTLQIT